MLTFNCIWSITPFLDRRLLDPLWIHLRPGTDLLRHIYTLLCRGEAWHELCDVLACAKRLHITLLHWIVYNHCLHLVLALNFSLGSIRHWDKRTFTRILFIPLSLHMVWGCRLLLLPCDRKCVGCTSSLSSSPPSISPPAMCHIYLQF